MKVLLVTLVVIVASCQSVQSYGCDYSQCTTNANTLEEIDKMMIRESNYHKFNIYSEGGYTYYSRAQYILRALNNKITNSYNQRSWGGGGGDSDGCKQLEAEILVKSKEFGIEKIGLESNLIRLRKVLDHQEQRNIHTENLLQESDNQTQTCVQNIDELENKIKQLNSTNATNDKKIKQQQEKIKSLENEMKKLKVKQNANAPAIHGETGKIYPADNNSISPVGVDEPALTSTTDTIAAPSSTEMTPESNNVPNSNETSTIPDIDLRNGS